MSKVNICNNCKEMKHRLVQNRWYDSEQYPIYGQLVCKFDKEE